MDESESISSAYILPSKPVVDKREDDNSISENNLPVFVATKEHEDIRLWKLKHEEEMFNKLIESQQKSREQKKQTKNEISKLLRKVPVLLLTREFLNKDKLTIDDRAYVIDKLIPVVVLGLEKLLIEADKRGLISKEDIEPNFNPIDFLGRYLMRNNPLFSNFNEASPYVRGMRKVCEELRMEIFHLSDSKLAKVKADAKNKREEREKEEQRKKDEAQRRIEIYQTLFDRFLIHNQTKVDYETVHLSIKSFGNIVEKFPQEMKHKLQPIIQMRYTDDHPNKLGRKDFGLLIAFYAESMDLNLFDQFAEHLSRCAKLYKSENDKEVRRRLLSNLFVTCDLNEMGMLDRQRILILFDFFYEQSPENIKEILRDPRHWPISDYTKKESDKNEANNNNFAEIEDADVSMDEFVGDTNENNEIIAGDEDEEVEAIKDHVVAVEEEVPQEEDNMNKTEDKEDIVVQEEESKEIEMEEKLEENLSSVVNKEKDDELPVVDVQESEKKDEEKDADVEIKEKSETEAVKERSDKADDELEMQAVGDVEKLDDMSTENLAVSDLPADDETIKSTKVVKKVQIVEDETQKMSYTAPEDTIKDNDNSTIDVGEDEVDIENDNIEEAESPVSESNNNEEANERELTKSSLITQSSAYDEENITFPQFFQVTEEFLGDEPNNTILDDLIEFIRENYEETPEERLKRMRKAHRKVISAKRRTLLDELFNVWEVDNSGAVPMKDICQIMQQYRNGYLDDGIQKAKKEARDRLKKPLKNPKLNRREFRQFCYKVAEVSDMLDEENAMESMITYFIGLVQRTFAEKMRSEARVKWLTNISWAGEISHGRFEGLYKSVFQAIFKDVEHHGGGKKVSISIALLERNQRHKQDGEQSNAGRYLLHFVGATPDHAEYVIGQVLDNSQKYISFHSIYTGNPIYLPQASANTNLVYFNDQLSDECKDHGSVVFVPVKDDMQRVFALMIVDSLRCDPALDPSSSRFEPHEIGFYQGVAKQFNSAFHQADMIRKLIKVSYSAAAWISRRIGPIQGVTFYLRERADMRSTVEYVLRQILCSDCNGQVVFTDKASMAGVSQRMQRIDNLFKKYLFDAIDTSQTVTANAYGTRNIAVPLRDLQGIAIAVIDINIGQLKFLAQLDNNEVMQMMNLLQRAYAEVIKLCTDATELMAVDTDQDDEDQDTTKKEPVEEAQWKYVTPASGSNKAELMFDQLMLRDLRASISRLDAQAYAELKSYKDPPVTIRAILVSLMTLLYPGEAKSGLFRNWEKTKKYISPSLSKLILAFDPFGDISEIPVDSLIESMQNIPHSEVEKHGSKPAKDIFDWVFCCVSLIEHRHISDTVKAKAEPVK